MTTHLLSALDTETPTLLSPRGVHSACDVTIQNVNLDGYIYLGSGSVSAESYGFRLMPSHSISFELPGKDFIYAVSSAENMMVAVLTTNLESGS
jgi:hypothetical protein